MAKRHKDALAIQAGACNPSGIALSIVEACREIREEPHHGGTAQITSDPAVRLMVHQLAFICKIAALDDLGDYQEATRACVTAESNDMAARSGGELLDPLHRINPAASVTPMQAGTRPTYYECGCCECLHDARWDGDCRQDNARFNPEQLDAKHGPLGWDEIAMEDVAAWREI